MKASSRYRRTREPAVPGIENFWNFLRRQPALADFEQCSSDRPDHILEKTVAANTEDPCRLGAVPGGLKNDPGAVVDLRCRSAERGEIVRTEKIGAAPIHQIFVERVPEGIDVPQVKGADDRLPPDMVFVGLRFRGAPRVKLGTYFLDRQDPDFFRKQRIRSAKNGVGIHAADRFHAGNLSMRVDPGICAP